MRGPLRVPEYPEDPTALCSFTFSSTGDPLSQLVVFFPPDPIVCPVLCDWPYQTVKGRHAGP